MWSLLPRSTQISIIVIITAVLLLGLQDATVWYTGQPTSLFKHASMVTSIIGLVVIGVANWVWRPIWRLVPRLNKWFFPDLNGVWEGTLQTTWIDPTTGTVPGPISGTLMIMQNLFTTNIRLRTKDSKSFSTRMIAEVNRDADIYRLWYSYDNTPGAHARHRSARHEGAAWLEVSLEEDPEQLLGQYFTERRTSGDMTFRRVSTDMPAKP